MTDAEIELILGSVLSTKLGRIVKTSNAEVLKRRLYAVRASARTKGLTLYDNLSFRTSPTDPQREVWILNATK